MRRRLRIVLPPDWVLIFFAVLFAFLEGPILYVEWKMGQPLGVVRPGLYILRFAAFAYGVWRVAAFHPAYRPDYRLWLERTPWTPSKPTPAGPIALGWEDALPLGTLVVLSMMYGPSAPFLTLGCFLIGYTAALAVPMWTTGAGGFGYAITFGIGLAIRLSPDPRAFLGVMIATYAVGWIGLRVGLARFPWPAYEQITPAQKLFANAQETTCGWPFDQLQPKIGAGPKLARLDGLLIGLLMGWFLFAAESLITNPADRQVLVQAIFTSSVFMLAGFRTMIYRAGYSPPISLWGRIRTFRWIIPGYDQIFLGPICVLLVGVLAIDRFRPPGLDDLIVLPIAFSAAVSIALTTGPSLTRWRLTGRHRITATLSNKAAAGVELG